MSLAVKLPDKPPIRTSGQTFEAGARGDVKDAIDACVNGRGDRVLLPSQTLAVQARFQGKTDVTLELKPSTKITGPGGDVGVYVFESERIKVTGTGEIVVPDADGVGVYSGSDHWFTGGLRVHGCGGQGILLNQSGLDVPMKNIWINGVEAWDNGRPTAFAGGPEAGYWRFGCHSFYVGGGRESYVQAIVFDNHVHDQQSGYGIQLGGQAQDCIVAYNFWERIQGLAAGGVDGDRNARAIQVYSSYSNSKNNLITSNLMRDCPGSWLGSGPPAGIQGQGRYNVYWASGAFAPSWGGNTGLEDGGHNVLRDLKTLQECVDAGLFEQAFIGGGSTPPPPPPPPPAPSVHQTVLDGSKIKGTILWQADTTDDSQVLTMSFLVDGNVQHIEMDPPYGNGEAPNTDAGQYDTTKHLTDGAHVLSARADLKTGGNVRVDAHVTVENGVPVNPLRKRSETATTITLEWDPVPGAYGYRFFADGHPVSWTADGTVDHVKFAKGAAEYKVLVLLAGDSMTYRP